MGRWVGGSLGRLVGRCLIAWLVELIDVAVESDSGLGKLRLMLIDVAVQVDVMMSVYKGFTLVCLC